jgi:hypothetical protein
MPEHRPQRVFVFDNENGQGGHLKIGDYRSVIRWWVVDLGIDDLLGD